MFKIKNHRLHDDDGAVAYVATPNVSGSMTPELIVMHDTAGHLNAQSSVSWLTNRRARASAHIVLGRDGEATQLAPFNRVTWHAGRSHYKGRSSVSRFSIGIEIVNPGRLSLAGSGAKAWFGESYDIEAYDITAKTTPEHGSGLWMPYTEAQLARLIAISQALVEAYPTITAITTHWAISPGRKVDTNPLFPLDAVRARVFGRAEGAQTANDTADTAMTTIAEANQRRWPSYADNIIQVIPKASRVAVLRAGTFTNDGQSARWLLVDHAGQQGWVHGALLDEA